jgi:hypothetical protein
MECSVISYHFVNYDTQLKFRNHNSQVSDFQAFKWGQSVSQETVIVGPPFCRLYIWTVGHDLNTNRHETGRECVNRITLAAEGSRVVFYFVRGQLKCDGTRAETRFRLSAKRTSPFKSVGGLSSVDYWQPRCAHQR